MNPGSAAPPAAPALPIAQPFVAPAHWRAIDFISDLHLSQAMPATLAAFESHLSRTLADAVFILGDLFEVWVGDDERSGDFGMRCVAALAAASRQRFVAVMVGNRDFLIGPALLNDCGASALPDPTLLSAWGQRVLLTHGDALCLADAPYQAFRREVRSPAWQQAFLARPLAQRLRIAAEIRQASESRRRFDGDMLADIDRAATLELMRQAGAATLVHGHTHRPGSDALADGQQRHVLSDWDLDGARRAEVLRLTPAGFERLAPSTA